MNRWKLSAIKELKNTKLQNKYNKKNYYYKPNRLKKNIFRQNHIAICIRTMNEDKENKK